MAVAYLIQFTCGDGGVARLALFLRAHGGDRAAAKAAFYGA